MKKIFSKSAWAITTGLLSVLSISSIILSVIAYDSEAAINMALGTSSFETIYDENAEAIDFFKTSYEFERNGENLYKEDTKAIEEAEGEGAVLLWNNNTLPIESGKKVSLLSHNSVDLVECGSGSGYTSTFDYNGNVLRRTSMKEAFTSRGFEVNETLWNFYLNGAGASYKRTDPQTKCTAWQQWEVNEVPWSVYTSDVIDSFKQYNDIAVVTISRSGGEYSDLHYNYKSTDDTVGENDKGNMENTSINGGYLGLTDEEEQLLQYATNGTFKKVIVLLNTGNTLQMQDFEKYADKIDACMWIGQPGSTGINAVVDLLKGQDLYGNKISPSGRLTDTWAYNLNSAPATVNDGNYTYGNTNVMSKKLRDSLKYHGKYMVYQENIYVGYRYYETRYADLIAGKGNASSSKGALHSTSNWNYDEEVAFPFGYGVSYTNFEYSNYNVRTNGSDYIISVDVKNVGTYPGKEVVQAYLQKPYTEDDVDLQIEKSAIELAGFTKTKTLQPNESQNVKITVPEEYFKTFDSNEEGTYIIEEGTYYLTIASDAHVAINNILESENHNVSQVLLSGESRQNEFGKNFVYDFELDRDAKTYSKSTQTGADIFNIFDSGDINKYANKGDNSVTYLSRSDWDKTYPVTAEKLTLNVDFAMDLDYEIVPDDFEYDMPEYEKFESGSDNGKPNVEMGDLVAYQFINAPLNPESVKDKSEVYNEEDGLTYADWENRWNQLLDQMSFEEQCNIVVNAYHWIQGAESISLPSSRQENGPVGITKRQEAFFSIPNDAAIKNGTGWVWVSYPCAGIIGASFNIEVAQNIGEHKSEDMLYLGYNGIYGPGANLHRSPYGGRAFEYPSEDPLLTGIIEAYECIGIESKGCMAYVKHYALNDMETNRVNCGIWSTEQASREIYLRAFELVFTIGKASATMNSFTRIGTTWSGASYEMMTTVLREEWGYDGLVISDWDTTDSAMSKLDGVLAGTDTFDGNNKPDVLTKYADNAAVAQAVRTAVKRVIYNVVRTNVMNGMTINTTTVSVTPWWKTAIIAMDCTFVSLDVISIGMLITSIVLINKKKKQEQE